MREAWEKPWLTRSQEEDLGVLWEHLFTCPSSSQDEGGAGCSFGLESNKGHAPDSAYWWRGLRDRRSLAHPGEGAGPGGRWAGPDSTQASIPGSANPGARTVRGAPGRGCPGTHTHPPPAFPGILEEDDPGARPGAGHLMPGRPSRGCWYPGRCYGNGRQGLGGGPGPGWGRGGRRRLCRGDGGARPSLLRPLRHVLAASVLQR